MSLARIHRGWNLPGGLLPSLLVPGEILLFRTLPRLPHRKRPSCCPAHHFCLPCHFLSQPQVCLSISWLVCSLPPPVRKPQD